jgi:signal transduction histidine kinase
MLILDASVAGLGNAHDDSSLSAEHSDETSSGFKSSSNDDDEESTSSPLHKKSSSTPSRKHCPVLGFATPCRSDFEGDAPPPKYENFFEKDLARLFRSYPAGKVIDLTDDGNVVTTTDESDVSNTGILNEMIPEHAVRRKPDSEGKARTAKALRDMLPEARSIAFVPLWDYERSRWFAGCLCWSDRPDRKLSQKVDLAYFKVFGHSIMADLSRLDAIASDQAKTSFVASISHELRSPLHGILGSLEFLKDTALDSFQVSMINSLGACGHTLLDTINHVLDYAKITSTRARKSSKRLKGTKGVHFSSKPLRKRRRDTHLSKHPAIDLERVTEETVEAVVSGQACTILQAEDWDADSDSDTTTSGTTTRGSASKRSGRYIILDIAHEEDWNYHLPPGSWRRVVMNLVGNALKYTKDGHIHVSLRSSPNGESFDERIIHLAIKDSGRGMSQKFLANRAFQPFEQENSQSAGTGLGLSIVQQIIDSVGGKISVTSDLAQGTEVRVRFALLKPEGPVVEQPQRNRYLDNLSQLKGRRICILHLAQNPEPDETSTAGTREALNRFTNAMSYTLSEHLKMQVIQTEAWEGHDADIVICPEPCFQYLALIRHRRTIDQRAPVTIFVAVDALEAATLRTDVRVKSRESVVEVMMQP